MPKVSLGRDFAETAGSKRKRRNAELFGKAVCPFGLRGTDVRGSIRARTCETAGFVEVFHPQGPMLPHWVLRMNSADP